MSPKTAKTKQKRTLIGKVVSTKMNKTVVVEVTHFTRHVLYQKPIRRTRRYACHCEIALTIGDQVKITESKPIAKTVHFTVTEKLTK